MLPLQRLAEALIELLLYEANEGGGEGRLLAGLRPQPRDDPGCLLQEEEHLVSGGVDPIVSQKQSAKHGPSLYQGLYFVPACNGGDLLLTHQKNCVCKGSHCPAPKISPHFRVRKAASDPANGEMSVNKKMFSVSSTLSTSLV